MLIRRHSWIFCRLMQVWLFFNQSRFYGFVQIPECWPRLWDLPSAKCMEMSPCRYACCATMKLCDGQCCARCGVHSVSGKTCCLSNGDDQCELVGPQPHAFDWSFVVVATGLVLLVVSLSCLFLRRSRSVREPFLDPPQPSVSRPDFASNSPRDQVVGGTYNYIHTPTGAGCGTYDYIHTGQVRTLPVAKTDDVAFLSRLPTQATGVPSVQSATAQV